MLSLEGARGVVQARGHPRDVFVCFCTACRVRAASLHPRNARNLLQKKSHDVENVAAVWAKMPVYRFAPRGQSAPAAPPPNPHTFAHTIHPYVRGAGGIGKVSVRPAATI